MGVADDLALDDDFPNLQVVDVAHIVAGQRLVGDDLLARHVDGCHGSLHHVCSVKALEALGLHAQ